MKIELTPQQRADALASMKRYVEENLECEPMGDMRAGFLLDYLLDEIGPSIYNKAVEDAQARVQIRAADLSGELFLEEFQYWSRGKSKRG